MHVCPIAYNYDIGEQTLKDFINSFQIKNGTRTTPCHNNQENTENYY